MSDPLRPRDRETPRRAAPLQPEKPGSGRRQESRGEQPEPSTGTAKPENADDRASERERAAVDNVREGYR
jgi:hypothetical protein